MKKHNTGGDYIMYKKNLKEAVDRNKRFLKREMMDGILFSAEVIRDNPYLKHEQRDKTYGKRECLAISDREWVIEHTKGLTMIYNDVDDDTIRSIASNYPTRHYGEAIYTTMLGANIEFIGDGSFTSSRSHPPIIEDENDLYKLVIDEQNAWVRNFSQSAEYFAREAGGNFPLLYWITFDAMNLAVELMGATKAYLMLYENEELLRKICEFGVDYNLWFYELQKKIFEKNNREAFGDDELYDIYDHTWYSVDAYTICKPEVYDSMGIEYHQRLIETVGGGMMHTHSIGLNRLLPKIAKLKGLGYLQIGRDVDRTHKEFVSMDQLERIREITGDIPLMIEVSKEEFQEGVRRKTLPTGVLYTCVDIENIEEANKLAYIAKTYRR